MSQQLILLFSRFELILSLSFSLAGRRESEGDNWTVVGFGSKLEAMTSPMELIRLKSGREK